MRGGALGGAEEDRLAAEEPLEIRLDGRSLVVTMRTPGHDEELALGFVVNEGVARPGAWPVSALVNPLDPAQGNLVSVRVPPEGVLRAPSSRSFHASSACGVCGQASLDDMARDFPPVTSDLALPAKLLLDLPRRMREAQAVFDQTGGLHAAALFDAEGPLLCLREDVGRHNAVDKVTGWALRAGRTLPLERCALLVSGRAGYEVVQKAVASGIPLVAAVGAPSSLAARLAERAGVTLVGFLRERSFNVYAHPRRVVP
jgi:FdhD protein